MPAFEGSLVSVSRRVAMFCPRCGTQLVAELWESVNVPVNPDLRLRLFRRELNVVHCETCDIRMALPAPLLYHDTTLGFAVQYLPASALDDARALGRFRPDGSVGFAPTVSRLLEAFAYLQAPHVVFSIDEMLRYIEFREALAESHGIS